MQRMDAADISGKIIQAPAEFQDDSSQNDADLKKFFTQTSLKDQTVAKNIGPQSGTWPDIEATLDTQQLLGVTGGLVNNQWTSTAWMYTFSNNLFKYATPPNVVSISWGWSEEQQCGPSGIVQQECQTLGIDNQQYVDRVNSEFMKIGLRGVSLFVASGDSGANGRTDPGCTDKTLHASFPASSPQVTSVGATMLSKYTTGLKDIPVCQHFACATDGKEEAVSFKSAGFTSGGGFSLQSPRPAYQDYAVGEQLASGVELPPAGYFPRGGRAIPDVAAMGNNFLIVASGEWSPVGGTSAACPTWAAVGSRLNDAAVKKTGKPLGFLNPLLYKIWRENKGAYHDITEGDNKCTEEGCSSSCKGFTATRGWDAVSGLGSPDVTELEKHLNTLLDKKIKFEKEKSSENASSNNLRTD